MPEKGYKWTKEDIQKRADANRGKKRSAESKERMRIAQLKYNSEHDITALKRERALKQWSDPNAREMARQRALKQMSDPKARERLRTVNIGRKHTEETKRKMSKTHTINQRDPISRQIQSDAHKGCKSHLWEGGITPLSNSVRGSHRMRAWRNSVFARDNYTCTKCSITHTYLNAHHLIKFSTLMKKYNIKNIEQAEACDELWDISNGITLCKQCHKKIHKPSL